MTKYTVKQYDTIYGLEAAIEALDNTINIRPFNVISQNERKYALIVGGDIGTIGFDGGAI